MKNIIVKISGGTTVLRSILSLIFMFQLCLCIFLFGVFCFTAGVYQEILVLTFGYAALPGLVDIIPLFIVDESALFFILIVIFINIAVQIYSLDYLYLDRSTIQFLVILFVFSASIC